MPRVSAREHLAVARALLAAIDAELDHIEHAVTPAYEPPLMNGEPDWLNHYCIECGVLWRYPSPECPHKLYDRHPRN